MIELSEISLWGEDIPWLAGLRDKGRAVCRRSDIPTIKTEGWQKTVLPKWLTELKLNTEEHRCNGNCHAQEKLPFEAYQINFCNGRLISENFNFQNGLIIKPLIEAIYDNDVKQYLNKSFETDNFPFAAINTAFLEQGLFILVERGTKTEKPIYIHYHNHTKEKCSAQIRNLVVLEKQAQAEICEFYDGESAEHFFDNIVNEIFIGNKACLRHYKCQRESFNTCHTSLNAVQIKDHGNYNAFCAQNECMISRHESFIKLLDEGATAEVNGCYHLSEKSDNLNGICDMTTNIRHLAPHTFSNQLIKGIAESGGTGVFQGQIHIAPDSQQCEGYQLHRALLLNDNAEIYCKPELEIFADDVKCSHGASSGDLDKEQLFYLQSRGIEYNEAKKILITAYIDEVFQKITNPEIREWLKQTF